MPAAIWQWVYRALRRDGRHVTSYSAIDPQCFAALDLAARARERALDFHYRPRKDVFATRLWALRRVDLGNWNKGTLAGWGIDQRDPTADRRLIEYCLSIPATEFLSGGVMRALARRSFADRVPAVVLDEPRRGRQGADWHEGFNVARQQVSEEIARLDRCAAAARIIDLKRLHRMVEDWPERGWEGGEIAVAYRTMLLRALSGGHFLRRAAGQNG